MGDEATPTPGRSDNRLVARLATQRSQFRDQLKAVSTERDSLKARVTELEAQVTDLGKRADNTTAAARVEELEGELRGLKHRKVFDRIAGELKARPEALDDLFSLSGYKPAGDQVDEAAITAAIKDQATKRAYLFGDGSAPAGTGQTAAGGQAVDDTGAPVKPGAGIGRGGLSKGTKAFVVKRSDLRNAEWMRANQGAYAKALASNDVELID